MMMRRLSLHRISTWTVAMSFMVIVLLAVTLVGLKSAADSRDRRACEGALDTRQVIVEMLEFTGERQLNPDDYSGDLRDAVARSIRQGERFRNRTIEQLTLPPPQCEGVEL